MRCQVFFATLACLTPHRGDATPSCTSEQHRPAKMPSDHPLDLVPWQPDRDGNWGPRPIFQLDMHRKLVPFSSFFLYPEANMSSWGICFPPGACDKQGFPGPIPSGPGAFPSSPVCGSTLPSLTV